MNDKTNAKNKQKLTLHPEICLKCCWGRLEGDVLFCPFIEGTCMRRYFRRIYLNMNNEESKSDE